MAVLEIQGLTKKFGGLTAVNDVSFAVEEGEIRGLIGPNGAGKSTMFRMIAGFYKPTIGQILYQGQNIAGRSPSAVATRGVVRTFQETTLFNEFSVYDNVLAGCHLQARVNLFAALFRTDRKRQQKAHERTLEILDFMGLTERKDELAANLPHGLQRSLAIAIGLAANPKVLLLDEPFTGMNDEETKHMMALTQRLRASGVTIVLVEHDMKAVMGLCEYITVLNFGQLLAEGTPEEIRGNDKVIEAYLGGV
jgi:branched-chain amino acid transport system ATP-binding protein